MCLAKDSMQMELWIPYELDDLETVRQLIQDGQDVNRSNSSGTTPLMNASYWGHDQVVHELIRAGADVNGKDNNKQTALHKASSCGHSSVVKTLTEAGANLNVQDECGMTPLMDAALRGHDQIVRELIRAGADVNEKNNNKGYNNKQTALHRASSCGHSSVVTTLLEAGANLNVQDWRGVTPLMDAAYRGHANVVVELIRAGADVSIVSSHEWLSVAAGSTALHFAATKNSIECGVLLVEAGADLRTRDKDSESPLGLALQDFQQAIQQAQSFFTKRIVAVIGNEEHGKSTLIAALQAEGNSLLKKLTNRFTKVQDIRQRTAGIEAIQFSSQKYGEALFYDFAGQSNYHGPHQSFLDAMLTKEGVSVTLLLLAKVTDEEEVITRQVTHWLQPLSLTPAPSTPQVILVGSFLDQVESREEATEKLLRCTQSVQKQFHFHIQGPCLLDCRRPASEGIDQICSFLQENEPLQLNCKSFPYSLRWVLVQARNEFSVPAITLHTFKSWLLNDAKLNPQHFPPAEQICRDLTAVGHALFLPNKQDPSQSWLILDLKAILHGVYGTLFSRIQGKVNQFGLLHCSQLTELLPELDPAMIQEVLISLEFCIKIDSSLLQEELLKLTERDEGDNWLYFPALVSAQPLHVFPNVPDPHHAKWLCWQLRTTENHFISAHLLQTIILRLAANHVFTHKLSPNVKEHCCSVWVNGLSWMSTKGVDIAVQISDSSVVQVVGRSKAGPEKLHQYTSTIVSDVIRTTAQVSPKLETTSYIVHPYTPAMWEGAKTPTPESLYPVSSIIHCISDGGDHVLSRTRQDNRQPHQTSLTELFGGWSPPLSVVKDMDFKREPQRVVSDDVCPNASTEAVVTFGYDAQLDNELTLREGQVLRNVRVVGDGWAKGELFGKVGFFPSNFVKMKKGRPEDRPLASLPNEDSSPPPVAVEGPDCSSGRGRRSILSQTVLAAAQQVLDKFRDQFIKDMDSSAVVLDLLHYNIINEGDQKTITTTMDRTQQNKFLHLYLRKCTVDAFHLVCDIISGVKGNPKMSALGTAMKQSLQKGATVSPSALGEPHTTTQHTVTGAHTQISIDSHPTLEDINKLIVREVPSSAPISSAPTTDGKQLPSVTISKIHPDKPLVPITKEGGAATPHHDDPTPPTSADTHTHFSIDAHPTLEDINKFIVREVAADWKQVATFLGVEPSVISTADTDHPQQYEHACTDIFERWLSWKSDTGRKKRTWRTVLSAVEEAGYKALSQQLQTEVLHLQ